MTSIAYLSRTPAKDQPIHDDRAPGVTDPIEQQAIVAAHPDTIRSHERAWWAAYHEQQERIWGWWFAIKRGWAWVRGRA